MSHPRAGAPLSTHRRRPRPAPTQRPCTWRLVAVVVFVVAGALFVTSGLDAGGLDLRASSVTDLDTVVRQQRRAHRRPAAAGRRSSTARSTRSARTSTTRRSATCSARSTSSRVPPGSRRCTARPSRWCSATRPRRRSTAPWRSGEVTADQLVVHQQDIQAVVNALWSGGAEAMTLQNQRVVSTTGIKCVGNTVVLHGVPYAPPYEITAIGDLDALQDEPGLERLHRRLQDLRRRPQPRLRGEHRRRRHHAGVRAAAATCATPRPSRTDAVDRD